MCLWRCPSEVWDEWPSVTTIHPSLRVCVQPSGFLCRRPFPCKAQPVAESALRSVERVNRSEAVSAAGAGGFVWFRDADPARRKTRDEP